MQRHCRLSARATDKDHARNRCNRVDRGMVERHSGGRAERPIVAHSSPRKGGLEFDHVAILNGGWDRVSRNEDHDAPRRLFYVAMTRAQQSLTVLTSGKHPLLNSRGGSVLKRRVIPDLSESMPTRKIYQLPNLDVVDLSFAGRQRNGTKFTSLCAMPPLATACLWSSKHHIGF